MRRKAELLTAGRSPRARSSQRRQGEDLGVAGSISACAEQPICRSHRRRRRQVDLRVRGAAELRAIQMQLEQGRSPRARSSPHRRRGGRARVGSISACAEQPGLRLGFARPVEVDLRVRGAAPLGVLATADLWGRSPRARSSRRRVAEAQVSAGSISACAEQPSDVSSSLLKTAVDLRVRGAATLRADALASL